jgi:hypothetical protein
MDGPLEAHEPQHDRAAPTPAEPAAAPPETAGVADVARRAGNAVVSRWLTAAAPDASSSSWTAPFLSRKRPEELLRDGLAGDVGAVKAIPDYTKVSEADRLGLIRTLLGQSWVGPRDRSALARLWSSFDDLPAAVTGAGGMWQRTIDVASGVVDDVPAARALKERFPRDVRDLVTSFLYANRDLTMAQLSQLTASGSHNQATCGTAGDQNADIRRMQEAAGVVAKLQKAQEAARETYVGYREEQQPISDFTAEQPPGMLWRPGLPVWMPEKFNPSSPPAFRRPPSGGLLTVVAEAQVQDYDKLLAAYDAAGMAIALLIARHPALYAVSREGKSTVTADFARLDDAVAASEQIANGLRKLLADIEASQIRLDAGKLDPLDLTPVHATLVAGGQPSPSGTDWSQPLAKPIVAALVKDHDLDRALTALGLQVASEALFLLAPLAGPAALFVMLAGLGVTAAKAEMSTARLQALEGASKTAITPGTELVEHGAVEDARVVKEADDAAVALAALSVGVAIAGEAIGAISSARSSSAPQVEQGVAAFGPAANDNVELPPEPPRPASIGVNGVAANDNVELPPAEPLAATGTDGIAQDDGTGRPQLKVIDGHGGQADAPKAVAGGSGSGGPNSVGPSPAPPQTATSPVQHNGGPTAATPRDPVVVELGPAERQELVQHWQQELNKQTDPKIRARLMDYIKRVQNLDRMRPRQTEQLLEYYYSVKGQSGFLRGQRSPAPVTDSTRPDVEHGSFVFEAKNYKMTNRAKMLAELRRQLLERQDGKPPYDVPGLPYDLRHQGVIIDLCGQGVGHAEAADFARAVADDLAKAGVDITPSDVQVLIWTK